MGETNRQFAQNNEEFKEACKRVNVEPTTRQASKWRNNKGKAWKEGRWKECGTS